MLEDTNCLGNLSILCSRIIEEMEQPLNIMGREVFIMILLICGLILISSQQVYWQKPMQPCMNLNEMGVTPFVPILRV